MTTPPMMRLDLLAELHTLVEEIPDENYDHAMPMVGMNYMRGRRCGCIGAWWNNMHDTTRPNAFFFMDQKMRTFGLTDLEAISIFGFTDSDQDNRSRTSIVAAIERVVNERKRNLS